MANYVCMYALFFLYDFTAKFSYSSINLLSIWLHYIVFKIVHVCYELLASVLRTRIFMGQFLLFQSGITANLEIIITILAYNAKTLLSKAC